jgi:hypothetical protein
MYVRKTIESIDEFDKQIHKFTNDISKTYSVQYRGCDKELRKLKHHSVLGRNGQVQFFGFEKVEHIET